MRAVWTGTWTRLPSRAPIPDRAPLAVVVGDDCAVTVSWFTRRPLPLHDRSSAMAQVRTTAAL
jgi:hypothetical protein